MHLGVSSTCCGERKNNGKKISSTTHLENCDHPIRLQVFFLCFGWWYGGASIGAAIFCNYQTGFARISIMAGILLHVTHYFFFNRCFCCPQVFFQSSVNRPFSPSSRVGRSSHLCNHIGRLVAERNDLNEDTHFWLSIGWLDVVFPGGRGIYSNERALSSIQVAETTSLTSRISFWMKNPMNNGLENA